MREAVRSLRRFINGNEKAGGEGWATGGFADRFDFPVDGRAACEERLRLIGRNREFDGNAVASDGCEARAVEREGIFVDFVANNLLRALLACPRGDVALLDATEIQSEFVERIHVTRGAQPSLQAAADEKRKRAEIEAAISVAKVVEQHRAAAI